MKKLIEKLLERLLAKPLRKLAEHIDEWNREADAARAAEESQPETPAEPEPETPAEPAPAAPADAVDYSLLSWCWGGFKGASATAVAGVAISSLRVTSSGLSYKWSAGGCERLGASSREDHSRTVACLFCRIDGRWSGGKFDWISTSRTTRDFKNVRGGYGGWRADAIEAADAYAFCIVSADGRRRTNIIEARK